MTKSSTKTAGIDTGKAYLDIAIHAASDSLRVSNDSDARPLAEDTQDQARRR